MDGVSASTPAGLTPRCLTSESECLHARDIFQRCGVATRWKIPAIKQKNNGNNQTAMKNNAAAGGHLRGRSCHPMRGKIFSLPFASATVLQGRQPETEKILPRRVVRKTKRRPINSWCARTTVPHGHLLNRDSPDDCRSAVDIHAFPAFLQDRARCRRLPAPWAARTLLDGLTWPFSLAFGRTPPIGCR